MVRPYIYISFLNICTFTIQFLLYVNIKNIFTCVTGGILNMANVTVVIVSSSSKCVSEWSYKSLKTQKRLLST